MYIGDLQTGTETGFTGSRSPIRIQCGLAWAPHGTQTTRIALLDWVSPGHVRAHVPRLNFTNTFINFCRKSPQHRIAMQWHHNICAGSGSRPCGSKVVFGSPICIGFRSKVPWVERAPMCYSETWHFPPDRRCRPIPLRASFVIQCHIKVTCTFKFLWT